MPSEMSCTIATPSVWGGVLLLVFVLFYALISGAEISFFSTTLFQEQQLKECKNYTGRLFAKMMERPVQFLVALLIAKIITFLAIIICAFQLPVMLLSSIETLIIIFVLLFIAVFFTKKYAKTESLRFIHICSYPIYFLFIMMYPITVLFAFIFGSNMKNKLNNVSLDEISDAIENVDVDTVNGDEKKEDALLLKGIVRFGEIEAKEIMRLREDIVAIEQSMTKEKVFSIMLNSGYTRFPVYESDLDHIIGILVFKDFLPCFIEHQDFDWKTFIRSAFFVSENKKIDTLMQEFQKKNTHLAIIVDEYGGTSGIVTMEDVLEEIVGEIGDEYDADDENCYRKIDENTWEFEAKTHLSDFCKILNLNDDAFDAIRDDADSLGGLVLALAGKIPQKFDTVQYKQFCFKVIELNDRRVIKVLVTITNDAEYQQE